MSPCDLPLWYLRLTWGQAQARCAADAVPAEYWRCYKKAWCRRYGRHPYIRNGKGRLNASKDFGLPALQPSSFSSA